MAVRKRSTWTCENVTFVQFRPMKTSPPPARAATKADLEAPLELLLTGLCDETEGADVQDQRSGSGE